MDANLPPDVRSIAAPTTAVPAGPATNVIVRRATTSDLAAVASVSLATGQPAVESGADPRYAGLLLEHGIVVVAEQDDGHIVGWGATWRTPVGEVLSDLFVDPRRQGQGVGARILRTLWPDPEVPGRFTFSSQYASALPLYVRAGLRPVWPLLYLTGDPRRLPVSATVRARLVSPDEAAATDARLTRRTVRAAEYRYWAGAPSGTAVVVHEGNRLLAAGAGRPAELAHLTCVDEPQDATAALTAALLELDGSRVCLPGPHPALGDVLSSGWRVEDYDLAMSTPDLRLPTSWAYSPGLA